MNKEKDKRIEELITELADEQNPSPRGGKDGRYHLVKTALVLRDRIMVGHAQCCSSYAGTATLNGPTEKSVTRTCNVKYLLPVALKDDDKVYFLAAGSGCDFNGVQMLEVNGRGKLSVKLKLSKRENPYAILQDKRDGTAKIYDFYRDEFSKSTKVNVVATIDLERTKQLMKESKAYISLNKRMLEALAEKNLGFTKLCENLSTGSKNLSNYNVVGPLFPVGMNNKEVFLAEAKFSKPLFDYLRPYIKIEN